MEKTYLKPETEVLVLRMEKSLLLPASPTGHTDESLSRTQWTEELDENNLSMSRTRRNNLWDDEEVLDE